MTTLVHIFNAGPRAVEVKTGQNPKQTVYAQQSTNVYVHDGACVLIEEVPEKPKQEG